MEEKVGEKITIPVAIIAAGALVAVAILFTNNPGPSIGSDVPNNDEEAREQQVAVQLDIAAEIRPVDNTDHILGNPNAEVFLIEYTDLECPFCKRFHTTGHEIIDEFGKSGKVAWVIRHFPIESIHSKAVTEAEATECVAELAGNDAFWAFVDKLFEVSPTNNGLDLALLPEIAESVGVDRSAFNDCLESGRHSDRIDRDIADGIAAGVSGTPHSILLTRTGRAIPVRGAQPANVVRAAIQLALDGESI